MGSMCDPMSYTYIRPHISVTLVPFVWDSRSSDAKRSQPTLGRPCPPSTL